MARSDAKASGMRRRYRVIPRTGESGEISSTGDRTIGASNSRDRERRLRTRRFLGDGEFQDNAIAGRPIRNAGAPSKSRKSDTSLEMELASDRSTSPRREE